MSSQGQFEAKLSDDFRKWLEESGVVAAPFDEIKRLNQKLREVETENSNLKKQVAKLEMDKTLTDLDDESDCSLTIGEDNSFARSLEKSRSNSNSSPDVVVSANINQYRQRPNVDIRSQSMSLDQLPVIEDNDRPRSSSAIGDARGVQTSNVNALKRRYEENRAPALAQLSQKPRTGNALRAAKIDALPSQTAAKPKFSLRPTAPVPMKKKVFTPSSSSTPNSATSAVGAAKSNHGSKTVVKTVNSTTAKKVAHLELLDFRNQIKLVTGKFIANQQLENIRSQIVELCTSNGSASFVLALSEISLESSSDDRLHVTKLLSLLLREHVISSADINEALSKIFKSSHTLNNTFWLSLGQVITGVYNDICISQY